MRKTTIKGHLEQEQIRKEMQDSLPSDLFTAHRFAVV